MSRAYEGYTRGLRRASRVGLVGVLVAISASCVAAPPDGDDTHASAVDLISTAADSGVQPKASGTSPPDTAPQSDCTAGFCAGHVARLAEYCDEPHTRCPADIAEARAIACRNRVADASFQFQSTCGGASIRIQYPYGAIDYHYDATGTLTAIITFVRKASEACETDVYLYGEPSCRAGAMEQVSCT